MRNKLFWITILLLSLSAFLPLLARYQHIFIEAGRIPGLKRVEEGIYYGDRIAFFNTSLLVLLIFYRLFSPKACLQNFKTCENWLRPKDYRIARLSVAFVIGSVLIAFFFKLHFIFATRGNPGWTYKHIKLPIESTAPDYYTSTTPPDFLMQSVSIDALEYINNSGYIEGDSYFMHFNNGQVLPFNLNLLRNTHPFNRFGHRLEKQNSALIEILKKTYKNLQKGHSTWLPIEVALPNHIVRQHIDYSKYPPFEELVSISVWRLLLKIDSGKKVSVDKAILNNEIFIEKSKE